MLDERTPVCMHIQWLITGACIWRYYDNDSHVYFAVKTEWKTILNEKLFGSCPLTSSHNVLLKSDSYKRGEQISFKFRFTPSDSYWSHKGHTLKLKHGVTFKRQHQTGKLSSIKVWKSNAPVIESSSWCDRVNGALLLSDTCIDIKLLDNARKQFSLLVLGYIWSPHTITRVWLACLPGPRV